MIVCFELDPFQVCTVSTKRKYTLATKPSIVWISNPWIDNYHPFRECLSTRLDKSVYFLFVETLIMHEGEKTKFPCTWCFGRFVLDWFPALFKKESLPTDPKNWGPVSGNTTFILLGLNMNVVTAWRARFGSWRILDATIF